MDGFRKVNDSYGHQASDAVLRATAAIVKNSGRRVDVVARYGGRQRFANAEALVKAADQALYTDRLQGRNRTACDEATARAPVVRFL